MRINRPIKNALRGVFYSDALTIVQVLKAFRGIKKRSIHTQPSTIWRCAGAAEANAAFSEVINGTENLLIPAEFSLISNRRMNHRLRATVVEHYVVQLLLGESF